MPDVLKVRRVLKVLVLEVLEVLVLEVLDVRRVRDGELWCSVRRFWRHGRG